MSAEELEQELTLQLEEQQDALAAVLGALESDAEAEGMEEMKAALEQGISDMRVALLDLKKSRLLEALRQKEATTAPDSSPEESPQVARQAEPAGLAHGHLEGQHCLFRYTDGAWHAGIVRGTTGKDVQVDFLHPTRMHQLSLVTVSEDLVQVDSSAGAKAGLEGLEEGVRILARLPGGGGLWAQAEVLSTQTNPSRVCLIFPGHQSMRAEVGFDGVWLPPEMSGQRSGSSARPSQGDNPPPDSETDDSSEDSGGGVDDGEGRACDEGEGLHLGLGQAGVALKASLDAIESAAASGPQTDVKHFAEWETHTRGIASRMMAAMGYVTGTGLGKDKKGRALPLEVRLLQPGKGLGADEGRVHAGHNGKKKKRRRGGERHKNKQHAQRRKHAANNHAQHQLEAEMATVLNPVSSITVLMSPGTPGLFSFINSNLGDKSEAAGVLDSVGGHAKTSVFGQNRPDKDSARGHKAEGCFRQQMMNQQQKALQLKGKLARLGEMLKRNSNDKVIRQQVQRKIDDTNKELAAAEQTQRQSQGHENDKAKMKKWMKF